MKRIAFIFIIWFISAKLYSQNIYDYKLHISRNVGTGLMLNPENKTINNITLENPGLFYSNLCISKQVDNNIALQIGFTSVEYSYDMSINSIQNKFTNYYLWDKEYLYYSIDKTTLYGGISYKYQTKRFILKPFINIGFVDELLTDINSYKLKEKNANNIIQVNYDAKIEYDKFDYSVGVDFFYYLGKQWGISSTIQYDRFYCSSLVFTDITGDFLENYEFDSFTSNFKNIGFTFGFFLSLNKEDKKDKQ